MMGTADALPVEPVMKTTFVEDLTENQLAKAVSTHSVCIFVHPSRMIHDYVICCVLNLFNCVK